MWVGKLWEWTKTHAGRESEWEKTPLPPANCLVSRSISSDVLRCATPPLARHNHYQGMVICSHFYIVGRKNGFLNELRFFPCLFGKKEKKNRTYGWLAVSSGMAWAFVANTEKSSVTEWRCSLKKECDTLEALAMAKSTTWDEMAINISETNYSIKLSK